MCDIEEKQKWGVSYHEAGHTVVAIDMDWSVQHVLIYKGTEWKGQTSAMASFDDLERGAYFAAGIIARDKGKPDSGVLLSDQQDTNELEKLADKQLGEDVLIGPFASSEDKKKRKAFLNAAKKKAAEIIDRRWRDIKAIADTLFNAGKIEAQGINSILAPTDEGGTDGKA